MKQIFTPLLYLRISHAQKRRFDLWIPLFLTAIFLSALYFSDYWSIAYDANTKQSIISDRILTLLSALSGFFVAALAAIATFNGKNLDELMLGDPPTLRHGKYKNEPEKLTRRRFLSFLFGYLAFASFVYTILVVLSPVVGQVFFHFRGFLIYHGFSSLIFKVLSLVVIGMYSFLFFHIFIITLLGLHYLSERISRE
jgi:hypothetical protein